MTLAKKKDDILYWDVNSANYQYYPRKHDKYPAEYVKTHRAAPNNIGYTEPLSGVVSMWPDGRRMNVPNSLPESVPTTRKETKITASTKKKKVQNAPE